MNILHLKRLNAQGIDVIEAIIFSTQRLGKSGLIQFTINENDFLLTATSLPAIMESYPNFAQESAVANEDSALPKRVFWRFAVSKNSVATPPGHNAALSDKLDVPLVDI